MAEVRIGDSVARLEPRRPLVLEGHRAEGPIESHRGRVTEILDDGEDRVRDRLEASADLFHILGFPLALKRSGKLGASCLPGTERTPSEQPCARIRM